MVVRPLEVTSVYSVIAAMELEIFKVSSPKFELRIFVRCAASFKNHSAVSFSVKSLFQVN